jgi:kinesin family protein 1
MLGNSMLDKAWKGLNVTMFAYGQTGSGKSYTMFGYGADRGVVPTAADQIFERINANKDSDVSFQVTVYMVEIYMEKLQDLLVPKAQRGDAGL